jgi:alpha-galactosidase
MNRGNEDIAYTLYAKSVGISKNSSLRDLWLHKGLGKIGSEQIFTIPKHGIVVLKID